MNWFDRLIDFLFRTFKGRLITAGVLTFCAAMCSGCFLCTFPGCFCDACGCDICSECWEECDESYTDCASDACGDCAMDWNVLSCNCGDAVGSAPTNAGDCSCEGKDNPDNPKPPSTDDDDDCGGCGGCGGCGECDACEEEEKPTPPPDTGTVTIRYVVCDSNGDLLPDGEIYISSNDRYDTLNNIANYNSIPFWGNYSEYFYYEGAFTDITLENKIAGSDGVLLDGVKLAATKSYYVKLLEKAARGETYTLVFMDAKGNGSIKYSVDVEVGEVIYGFPTASTPELVVPGKKILGIYTENRKDVEVHNGSTKFHPYNFGSTENQIVFYVEYEAHMLEVSAVVENNTVKSNTYEYEQITVGQFLQGINTTVEGKKFLGWAKNYDNYRAGHVDIPAGSTSNEKIIDDITFYAVYKDAVQVNFHYVHGPEDEEVEQREMFVGDTGSFPETSAVGPYKFVGWYGDASFTKPVNSDSFNVPNSKSAHFYARWEIVDSYTIKYYIWRTGVNGYLEYGTGEYKYSENASTKLGGITETNEWPGYKFVGWSETRGDENWQDAITELPAGTYGNKELYAVYKPNSYQISMQPAGGAMPEGYDEVGGTYYTYVLYGRKGALPVPTRVGYNFTGWYLATTGDAFTGTDGVMLSEYSELGTVTLQAKWEVRKYAIKFVNEDVTVKEVSVAHGGSMPTKPDDPAKKGYSFQGWFDARNRKYEALSSLAVTTDLTFTAKYEANSYRVTLDADKGIFGDGNIKKTVNVVYDSYVSFGVPTRSGFDFLGWKDEVSGQLVTGADGVCNKFAYDSDVTLKALWSGKNMIFTLSIRGTEVGYPEQAGITLGELLQKHDLSTEVSGYRFLGWTTSAADAENGKSDSRYTNDYMFTAATTLYAVHMKEVTITLHNATNPSYDYEDTYTGYVGEVYELPLSRSGDSRVGGWYKDPHLTFDSYIPDDKLVIDESTTDVYPRWYNPSLDRNTKIVYVKNTGEGKETLYEGKYTSGSTVQQTANNIGEENAPDGHEFIGWKDITEGHYPDVFKALPPGISGGLELEAVYRAKTFKMRLDPYDDNSVQNIKFSAPDFENEGGYSRDITYGTGSGEYLPVPTSDSHIFLGWQAGNNMFTDENGNILSDYNYVSDVDLVPLWKIREYTLTFIKGDGSSETITEIYGGWYENFSGSIPQPGDKEGHYFVGWYIGDVKLENNFFVYADATFTARYEKLKFTITLDAGDGHWFSDGNRYKTITVEYGDNLKNRELFTPAGNGFNGWKTSEGSYVSFETGVVSADIIVTENLTFYADWLES